REHPEEKVTLAVDRCLKWKARQNDEVGILTTIEKADTWTDTVDKQQLENDNVEFLRTLQHMDGKMIGPMRMVVGYNYVEFVAGSQCERYEVNSKNFIENVQSYMGKIA
ncbi:MAG: hypothetical protein KAS32_31605, partial [Candidatus Peribacteraceae bacterium]|nr:hypothetical protein [Candidatus Peribacteraceae bacterium]